MTTATSTDLHFHLAPWLQDAIRLAVPLGGYLRLRVRLRGNTLHILCETSCPTEKEEITQAILRRMRRQPPPVQLLEPTPGITIHRLIVYGRLRQEKKSLWLSLIPLGQSSPSSNPETFQLNRKNQARLGYPQAIAQYLSQNLSQLGINIRVETQTLANTAPHQGQQRLWITCECDYSPDYGLLTESLVQRLRELEIKGFRDGAIRCQIRGEEKPEWLLWVDLTPPDVMLRQWGQWGDPEAISQILTQSFQAHPLTIRAAVTDAVLSLECILAPNISLAQAHILKTIQDILDVLAPQGLQRALIRAKSAPHNEELWRSEWSLPGDKPGVHHDSPGQLAQQGDLEAWRFLLQRCLNPDLTRRLATGGIHITLRQKDDTLYIMTEAIACPPQMATLKAIATLFRHLEPHPFSRLKVYGRRSGQSKALWQQSLKFNTITPARTSPQTPTETALPPVETDPSLSPLERFNQGARNLLQRSRLWQPIPDNCGLVLHQGESERNVFSPQRRWRVACLWLLGGILVTAQTDWLAGQWLRRDLVQPQPVSMSQTDPATRSEVLEAQLPVTNWPTTAPKAIAPPLTSPYPSFDNPLLDEKLALYQERIAKNGVPDVLIIGSSRALRGLDPLALQMALTEKGHPPLDIFNFGINGATVQIFDLLLRQILPPEQLPQLIILADGARAFNSGRQDLTYELMTRSPGFQALEAGTFSQLLSQDIPKHQAITSVIPDLEQITTQWLGKISQVYDQRQFFKERFFDQTLAPFHTWVSTTEAASPMTSTESGQQFNLDGFLPLDRRFIPETYYQNHTQVTGNYDGDYAAFNLRGTQHETFLELLDHFESHQIHLIFLNQPLTDYYLDPVRLDYERQFRQYFRQLANRENLDFVDFVHQQAWQGHYEWFSDPSHLNQFGAAQVAQELAKVSTIPWPQSTSD
ncbi:SGNH/GDSL hydrolase family protein [Picosynechococcus sp. PCC 8807]|uniref:SGNH/GDSL hydrolase family protein n=1 Tax=Picosynechococcus sp. PCC 8807 TaxID=195248 RepID=UPI00081044C5|nr:SGNH/GDSL hydrolase family protein [Picosynechococcus sp. PCC 8807]ANV90418.1 hypothetical protein AWQ24_07160 [Picosynechococcus sp. PCC 8807]